MIFFLVKGNMNGKTALVVWCTALVVLAVLCRFRSPVLFRWNPVEDTSLGKSGEGVHKDRMLGAATHDILFSLLLALILAGLSRGPVTFWLIVVLLTGEILHIAFGIRSATFRWLFEGPVQSAMSTEMAAGFAVLVIAAGIGYCILNPQKGA